MGSGVGAAVGQPPSPQDCVGAIVGSIDGLEDGELEGEVFGISLGDKLGLEVGVDGLSVGSLGYELGLEVGEIAGDSEGEELGLEVGDVVLLGDSVGTGGIDTSGSSKPLSKGKHSSYLGISTSSQTSSIGSSQSPSSVGAWVA